MSIFGSNSSNTALPSGVKSLSIFQGNPKGDSKSGITGFVGGSLFGSSGANAMPSAGDATTSTLTGQNIFSSFPSSTGGSLFGSAGATTTSILGTSSVLGGAVTAAGANASTASPQASVVAPQPLFTSSPSTTTAGVSFSIFGTKQGADAAETASSSRLFGGTGDHSKQSVSITSNSAQPGDGSGANTTATSGQSSAPVSAACTTAPGGLFASINRAPPVSSSRVIAESAKTTDGALPSGASNSARVPDAGSGSASGETTAVGGAGGAAGGAQAAHSSLLSASPDVHSSSLLGKTALAPASSSAADANTRKGGSPVGLANVLVPAASPASSNVASGGAADGLPSPQEVALQTLQHELLEEVLSKWERRLARRVEQFVTVAEDVDSVEKALIEESRKIQQVMDEQRKLERKQLYTAGVIDSLEHQQRDLITLLRSIEGALLELRCGGRAGSEKSSSGRKMSILGSYNIAGQDGRIDDAGVGFHLLRGEGGEQAGAVAAWGEPGSRAPFDGISLNNYRANAAPTPLLSAAEQLALDRLRSFDQQLAEIAQSLSYTGETFRAGPLGAVAQVLAIHQAALRAAARQATHIGEHMLQLQEAWEVIKDRSGSGGGLLKRSE